MIIWITGISGSGKTTLALQLIKKLKIKNKNIVNVDGDSIRDLFGNDLKYDIQSRITQIKRIQKLCIFLNRQKIITVVSALYSSEELLNWNRKNFKKYFEIYLKTSIDLAIKRDVKGLYKKFKEKKEKNIVGLDIPWNESVKCDLKVDMDKSPTIEETVNKVFEKINIIDF